MNPSEDGGHDWGSMLKRGDCILFFPTQSLLQRLFLSVPPTHVNVGIPFTWK